MVAGDASEGREIPMNRNPFNNMAKRKAAISVDGHFAAHRFRNHRRRRSFPSPWVIRMFSTCWWPPGQDLSICWWPPGQDLSSHWWPPGQDPSTHWWPGKTFLYVDNLLCEIFPYVDDLLGKTFLHTDDLLGETFLYVDDLLARPFYMLMTSWSRHFLSSFIVTVQALAFTPI